MNFIQKGAVLAFNRKLCVVLDIFEDNIFVLQRNGSNMRLRYADKCNLKQKSCRSRGKYCINNVCTAFCEEKQFSDICKVCKSGGSL